jgi:tetratricopeptide (TPR) repeat protein
MLMQKREDEALEQLEKASSLQPAYVEPIQYIAAIYMKRKAFDKAVERVNRQLTLAPDNSFFYNILGTIHEANSDLAAAESNLKKAVELNPNVPALQIALAGFYMRQKMTDKAKKQYETAIEKAPQALSPYMSLGLIYESEKNYKKAQDFYEKALKINPNFVPAANNLAYIYAEHGGNIDVALNLAQKAREAMPEDPHVADTLGWIYYKKNIFATAIGYLKESVDKNPNHPVTRYHLGMAYYKNGNHDLAKNELQAALKLAGDFPGADEARSTIEAIRAK